jgi:hypothetical protein
MKDIASFLFSIIALLMLHAIISRMLANTILAFVISSLASLLTFFLLIWIQGLDLAEIVGWIIGFALASELYFFLFTLSIGSVGSNILVLLSRRPMNESELNNAYSSRIMVDERIDRLLRSGLIFHNDNDHLLYPTSAARSSVRWLMCLAIFFGHRKK